MYGIVGMYLTGYNNRVFTVYMQEVLLCGPFFYAQVENQIRRTGYFLFTADLVTFFANENRSGISRINPVQTHP